MASGIFIYHTSARTLIAAIRNYGFDVKPAICKRSRTYE
jgi:hypothetical protein